MNWASGIVIPIYGAEPQDAYNGSGVSTYCAGPHFFVTYVSYCARNTLLYQTGFRHKRRGTG